MQIAKMDTNSTPARGANLGTVSKAMADLFPTAGSKPTAHRNPLIWDEGQRMFITDEYESAAGHRYYKGVRFCEQLAIVETVGLYHSFRYINNVSIYVFEGMKSRMVGSKDLDQFYNVDLIKDTTKQMVKDYANSQFKMSGQTTDPEELDNLANSLVERSYTSLLEDGYLDRIRMIIPMMIPGQKALPANQPIDVQPVDITDEVE